MQDRKEGFFIKNIIAIGDQKGANGEHFKGLYTYLDRHPVILNDGKIDHSRADRIVKQIVLLGKQAKKNHNIERLTRLITDEFSFFTRSTPLSLDEYKNIINTTSEALKTFPPNIVLIISSLPVLWSDRSIRNAILHIQTPNINGSLPIIHHFSKENFSKTDPYYSKHLNANQQEITEDSCYPIHPDDYSSEHSPDIVLKDTRLSCHSKNQYKSAIIVRGFNLPPIIEAIDICLDHSKQVAMRNVKLLLNNLEDDFPLYIDSLKNDFPLYIGHTLSSNTSKYFELALTAAPIQADWDNKQVADVSIKKINNKSASFGSLTTFYIYHQMRAEILDEPINISAHKINKVTSISINSIVDQHKNTLLHQIFIPNKTSIASPYQYRQLRNFKRIIPYFWGNVINQQNKTGNTPLHLALKITNDESILFKLLEHGARLDIKNKNDQSPIKWAYENNKTNLVELLLNKLMNDKNIYLTHKDSILFLLNDIEDAVLKIKIAASALCFEMSLTSENIDEKKAIELLILAEASPVKLFIQHNIDQLLATFKKGLLYYYLVNNNAIQERSDQISTLPTAIHTLLWRLDLTRSLITDERFSLYENGIFQLLNHFSESDRSRIKNLIFDIIKYIPDHELNINKLEHTINYDLLKNNQLVNIISSYLPLITDEKIKNEILHDCIKQFTCLEMINKELKNFPSNEKILKFAWCQLANIDFYGHGNDLNILEKMLLHAFKSQNSTLLDSIVLQSLPFITFMTIDKITSISGIEKINAQKWFYQNLLENELNRDSHVNVNIIFFTLTFYFFIDLNKIIQPSATIIELLIAKAYSLQNPYLLDRITQLIPITDLDSFVNKAFKLAPSEASIKIWVYQTLLKNEIKRSALANVNILLLALAQKVDIYEMNSINRLTLGEELILIACMQEDVTLLYQIKLKSSQLFNLHTIQKVAKKFSNKMRAQQWIFHSLIKNEFKRDHEADLNMILNVIPFCDLNIRSGIKSLTIGEQLLAQAYLSNYPYLLDYIKINCQFLFHPLTIDKIAKTFPNAVETKKWIFHELIKNEFKRGYQADINMLFFALAESPINLLNCGSGIPSFTIAEQLIAHAYYINNSRLISSIFAYLPALNLREVCQSLANIPHFPEAGVAWLNQELSQLANIIKNILANKIIPTPDKSTFINPSLTLFSPRSNENEKNNTSIELGVTQINLTKKNDV